MKKILGIVSSRRNLANGEILVKEAAGAIIEEHELELIRLPELMLETCQGCYTCLMPGKLCPLDDDLYFIVDKIKNADGIILSAPCYALGPSAVNKLFVDRIIALTQMIEDFWAKPCVIIATAGIEGKEGYTLTSLITSARFLGLDVKDAHMFLGALPGEVAEKTDLIERVRLLGQRLFGEKRQPENGECPTCWSDIWKFPQKNKALCPFCGQEATMISTDEGIDWKFGAPGIAFNRIELEAHFHEWLRGKVQEYLARRKELAEVRNIYKDQGSWVKPNKTS